MGWHRGEGTEGFKSLTTSPFRGSASCSSSILSPSGSLLTTAYTPSPRADHLMRLTIQ